MDKIKELQQILKDKHIKAYIIPSSDYHGSEYVSSYFKARAYMSGFNGSAGTLIVTDTEAKLWTDGRYWIACEKALENTSIDLMKMGSKGVLTIEEYLESVINDGDTLAIDGKTLSANFVKKLINKLNKNIMIKYDEDLVNSIWTDRPSLPKDSLFILSDNYSGASYDVKIAQIKEKMKEYGATMHVLTSLEDQAWLYNLRGNDVSFTPVFLAYTIITNDITVLYVDKEKLSTQVATYLVSINVMVRDYFEIYKDIQRISGEVILLDLKKVNYQIYSDLDKNTIIDKENPSLKLKAIKNETEIKNTISCHIDDGLAVAKLMYYVKTNVGKSNITELDAANYVENERRKVSDFIEPSFSTIAAYGANAAMMHYAPSSESNATLKPAGFLLVDSGATYYRGTTDITRTFALGKLSQVEKKHFTTVLRSMINLAKQTFMKGCTGLNLDILARGPVWDLLIDYKCGTGHGVGHILSVHEAPNGFRWQVVPKRNDSSPLEIGMITTDEPGIYLENEYGIRIENELLCISAGENMWGDFLKFETITFAPIDLDAIDASLLNKDEKEWLNNYHKLVYEKLSAIETDKKFLSWLKKYTKAI